MRPSFEHGDAVRVVRDVRNDGTYPGLQVGKLLVSRGSVGFICDMGIFLQEQIIYTVHFLAEKRLVGCREEELQRADAPWTPTRFAFRDKVAARIPLGLRGRVLVEQGEVGEIVKVLRGGVPQDVCYHVYFSGRNIIQVPESALDPAEDLGEQYKGAA